MRHWRQWVWMGLFVASCVPGAASAATGEVDILLDKLVEKGILTPVEAGLVRREIDETAAARHQALAKEIVPESARNWEWKGDVRLRDEIRNREGGGGQSDIHRQRIRFRYGFKAKVADDLKVEARLATGTSTDQASGDQDPVSTNQSFSTSFVNVPTNLDRANLQYAPEVPGVDSFKLIGGILGNPFWTVGPLVWDGDLSFHGVATQTEHELGPATFFTNHGIFLLDSEETEAASLWSTQAGVETRPFEGHDSEMLDELKVTAAVAYHDYKNVANATKAGTDLLAAFSDNTAGAHDFNELNPTVEVSTKVGGLPVTTWLDWVHNHSAGGDLNDGWQVGMKLGKAKTPLLPALRTGHLTPFLEQGWEAGYFWQELQSDAAFDEFVDSDFNGGGTNNRGHVFSVKVATLKHSTFGATYLVGEALKGAKDVEDRVQLDWETKF